MVNGEWSMFGSFLFTIDHSLFTYKLNRIAQMNGASQVKLNSSPKAKLIIIYGSF